MYDQSMVGLWLSHTQLSRTAPRQLQGLRYAWRVHQLVCNFPLQVCLHPSGFLRETKPWMHGGCEVGWHDKVIKVLIDGAMYGGCRTYPNLSIDPTQTWNKLCHGESAGCWSSPIPKIKSTWSCCFGRCFLQSWCLTMVDKCPWWLVMKLSIRSIWE